MVVVGLMADPGLPERLAEDLGESLEDALKFWTETPMSWDIEVSCKKLPLDEDGRIPLMNRAKDLRASNEWDYIVYITDLPRIHDHQTLLTESDSSLGAALVSLPALGWYRVRQALHTEVLRVIKGLADKAAPAWREDDTSNPLSEANAQQQSDGTRHHVTIPGSRGQWRLLGGMIRSNRPGRLVGSLSSAGAAAMATGAFGIFYASIWNMADSSSTMRLSLISVVAITALTGWLIVHNGLWSTERTNPNGTPAAMDNASTTVTVLLSVAVMYAGLYIAVLLGSLVVISEPYMQAQLGHPVSIVEYANLSWLSASLGTLAGALGSNFDGDAAVRKATYSGRELQRRQLQTERTPTHGNE